MTELTESGQAAAASPEARGMTDIVVRVSLRLRDFVDRCGRAGSIFILPLVLVTMWDVVVRKIGGLQYWLIQTFGAAFESTIIQELEWHFHTAFFTLVLGYAYVHNRHVRVDLVRERLDFRTQAWIEFLGCSLFLIPYTAVVIYFAYDFAYSSYQIGEISASLVGLPHRWIIKSVLVAGLALTLLAGLAVWLQTVLVLFGPRELRFKLMTLEWPEARTERRRREIAGV